MSDLSLYVQIVTSAFDIPMCCTFDVSHPVNIIYRRVLINYNLIYFQIFDILRKDKLYAVVL